MWENLLRKIFFIRFQEIICAVKVAKQDRNPVEKLSN